MNEIEEIAREWDIYVPTLEDNADMDPEDHWSVEDIQRYVRREVTAELHRKLDEARQMVTAHFYLDWSKATPEELAEALRGADDLAYRVETYTCETTPEKLRR